MKNYNEKTIVAFKIARGGHLSFIGENVINDFTYDLFVMHEHESLILSEVTEEDEDGVLYLLRTHNDKLSDEQKVLITRYDLTPDTLGELCYYDGGINKVGLSVKEAESGIGRIDIDGEYDTTYTKYLSDCDEDEIEAMKVATGFKGLNVEAFI